MNFAGNILFGRVAVDGFPVITATQYAAELAKLRSAVAWWKTQTSGKVVWTITTTNETYTDPAYTVPGGTVFQGLAGKCGVPYGDKNWTFIAPVHSSTGVSSGWPPGSTAQPKRQERVNLVPLWTLRTGSSYMWIRQSSSTSWSLYAHELGHTLGLYHSNRLLNPKNSDLNVRYKTFADSKEYGFLWDIMGPNTLQMHSATLQMLGMTRTGQSLLHDWPTKSSALVWDLTNRSLMFDLANYDVGWLEKSGDVIIFARQQRDQWSSGGVTAWDERLFAVGDNDQALPILVKGRTYVVGDKNIEVLDSSKVRLWKS